MRQQWTRLCLRMQPAQQLLLLLLAQQQARAQMLSAVT
jgi:hypothetical protein